MPALSIVNLHLNALLTGLFFDSRRWGADRLGWLNGVRALRHGLWLALTCQVATQQGPEATRPTVLKQTGAHIDEQRKDGRIEEVGQDAMERADSAHGL